MPRFCTSSLLPVVALLGAVLLLSACEDTVDPILESNRNFTLFGTLDMNRDTQFVRVVPIRPRLLPTDEQQQNITLVSTDLVSGEQRTWEDSLLTFADGTRALVFYESLRIRPERTYRIEVSSPELDLVTSAETTAPVLPTAVTVFPAEVTGGVGGAVARGTQRVVWEGIDQEPYAIDLWYRFLTAEGADFTDVQLPYAPRNEAGGGGWEATLDLREDRLTLDTLVAVREVPLLNVAAQLTALDNAFVPPGGAFDPDVLAQPGTFSNVENGFGFIGSVGRFVAEWTFTRGVYEDFDYLRIEDVFGKRGVAGPPTASPDGPIRVPVRLAPGE